MNVTFSPLMSPAQPAIVNPIVTFVDEGGDSWTLPLLAFGMRKHVTVGSPEYRCFLLTDSSVEFATISEETFRNLHRNMIVCAGDIPYTKFWA